MAFLINVELSKKELLKVKTRFKVAFLGASQPKPNQVSMALTTEENRNKSLSKITLMMYFNAPTEVPSKDSKIV